MYAFPCTPMARDVDDVQYYMLTACDRSLLWLCCETKRYVLEVEVQQLSLPTVRAVTLTGNEREKREVYVISCDEAKPV